MALAAALAACGGGGAGGIGAPSRLALVYRTHGDEFVLAAPSGRSARALGTAAHALLAPDGASVLAVRASATATDVVEFVTARRRAARILARLAAPRWAPGSVRLLAWSADSRYCALIANQLSGAGVQSTLLVLNVADGRLTPLASGNFLGASFSPTLPDRLVYSEASVAQLDRNESLLYETAVPGTHARTLTHSGLAAVPAWGASGIVFAKLLELGTPTAPPEYALWLLAPGERARRLGGVTTGPPSPNASGTAIWISANGERLVANVLAADGSPLVVALALHGARATVHPIEAAGAQPVAAGISRSGGAVLLRVNSAAGAGEVVSVPWSGGHPRVLASPAGDPSWNG